MKVEALKNAVTSKIGRQVLIGKKHSPAILFAGGVAGVITTTVLACRATLRVTDVLDALDSQRTMLDNVPMSEKERSRQEAKVRFSAGKDIARLYAPSIGVGVISIGMLTGSHVVLSRRNAAVVAAYSALDRGFSDYRQRVRDELGEDKELEFRHGVEVRQETVVDEDGKKKVVDHKVASVPSVYARFFDEFSSSWSRQPESNQLFLNCQQNYANDLLRARGHVFLNEVYDLLGIPRSKAGAVVGWIMSKDGDNFIDFGIYDHTRPQARAFVQGQEKSILLDFNVDGVIYDLI